MALPPRLDDRAQRGTIATTMSRKLLLLLAGALLLTSCFSFSDAGPASVTPGTGAATAAAAPAVSALPSALAGLARILKAPLPAPLAEVPKLIDLPKGYPIDRALALNRLNQYRAAAGLAPYVYDPRLSVMGQAHADYLLANAGANIAFGHFEIASNRYYTKAGDEAARTSGLVGADPDPLDALEGLMSGVFHRVQFLRPEETRVGMGSSYDAAKIGGGTLFVTREPAAGSAKPKRPFRFIVFPPDGFNDALSTFNNEFPDPRPGHQPNDPPTGYPITISLVWDDVKAFENAAVTVTNERGDVVPAWVSFPGKPAVASPDMSIYSGDAASIVQGYRDNYDAVFVLPKQPLERGVAYAVRAELKIAGKTETLSWTFRTRGARLWEVRPNAVDPRQDLSSAILNASEGDTIKLAAGDYVIRSTLNLDKSIRIIGDPRHTTLRYAGKSGLAAIGVSADVILQGIDLLGDAGIYLGPKGRVLLEDCRFIFDVREASLATCERGSILAAERCDFTAYASPTLAYFLDTPPDAPEAALYLGVGNSFGSAGKHSYGAGVEQGLSRPMD